MENARKIWEELGLPRIVPQSPWHGYSLGDWSDLWQQFADNAVKGDWAANGANTYGRRRGGLTPETPVRNVEKTPADKTGKSS
jgi:4-hydroxy-3-polyprenylbenzoate decarboxylase